MPSVLVVEDDIDLSTIICDLLLAQDYKIEAVYTGTDAVDRLKGASSDFDLLILDWDLPGITGPEICKGVRDEGGSMPILMLTGRSGLDEKEAGFDAGADDYLTKPFAMKELGMRIKALMRRAADTPKPVRKAGTIEPGQVIDGKYKIEQQIGEGGMGLIFKATHLNMERTVVIKAMHSHLMADPTSMQRFDQEQKLLAKIVHPNVVAIYDVGLLDGKVPYIVMEYIYGESVFSLVSREGNLSVAAAASILINVCNGLQAAHNQGIVHRDLKPENILLLADASRADWVKVVDFGTAILTSAKRRLTEQNMVIGTAEFISPEQLNDVTPDGRADIYALGVILFYMLTDDVPYKAAHTEALLLKIILETPTTLSNVRTDFEPNSPVEAVISKAMQKNRDDRYQTADEMRLALEHLLHNS